MKDLSLLTLSRGCAVASMDWGAVKSIIYNVALNQTIPERYYVCILLMSWLFDNCKTFFLDDKTIQKIILSTTSYVTILPSNSKLQAEINHD